MFPSYRNQSVDLQSKSTDCFLYAGNIGRQRVNREKTKYSDFQTILQCLNKFMKGSAILKKLVISFHRLENVW